MTTLQPSPTSDAALWPPVQPAHIIVVGNEKGGSGKSTTAMHVIVSLLRDGYSVGSLDLDARQGTLTRYINNRKRSVEAGEALPLPRHAFLQPSELPIRAEAEEEDRERFDHIFNDLLARCDFLVVDTPGSNTFLGRLAHSHANTLLTPLNDSYIDLDMLANVDASGRDIVKLSVYSEMVFEQRKARMMRDRGAIDWVVMRNRLSNLNARNKQDIADVMTALARRIGFRIAPGFSERVIFRELFPRGLTMLDLLESGESASMSHLSARQEVRNLIEALNLPERRPKPQSSAA
ncbi:MAG: division plane positioning ATPase MipZ [Alphaproteobacteria bacterium]|nr:division plane positioning ATPase MipZ [Alphaproteobacteria bacterium]MBU0798547.1 division plane positioning ATPase MipZ [Alphaproteobacteria bacterium]MBU0885698.1 division plane positioning ATPase MipZ [Alphaproteobacteria bacterium]MBU1813783.1 division plane positioning ATPase MipZ [Alphaproteobacteria bacterium]MBU2091835.1 division plane positioning ATPase MipZ [Alphaproteobacteria bacterium]